MIDLSKFKKKVLTGGEPYLSVTDTGITFNKNCLVKLDYPEKVMLYVDESSKQILIMVSNDEDSMIFVSSKRKDASYVRWNNGDFRDELLDWASSFNYSINQTTGVKVLGVYLPDDKAILFDFKGARPLKKTTETDLPF